MPTEENNMSNVEPGAQVEDINEDNVEQPDAVEESAEEDSSEDVAEE